MDPRVDATSSQERSRRALLGIAAAFYAAYFLGLSWARLHYPFALHVMEPGMLSHVLRVLAGQPLYGPPSLEHTAYVYHPLYYYVSAAAVRLLGEGYFALRMVSAVSTVLTALLVGRWVQRESRDLAWAAAAAALYLASFGFCDGFFDLARVDALMVLLTLLSVYLLVWGRGAGALFGAGIFAALAFWTKQTALLVLLPAALTLVRFDRLRAIWFWMPCLALGLAFYGTSAWTSGGWSVFYTIALERHHSLETVYPEKLYLSLLEVIRYFPIAAASVAVFVRREVHATRSQGLYLAWVAGSLGSAAIAAVNWGAQANLYMPVSAAFAVGFGAGLSRLGKDLDKQGTLAALTLGAALLQFAVLLYHPLAVYPGGARRSADLEFVRTVESLKAPVLILSSRSYWTKARAEQAHASVVALWDVFRSKETGPKDRLRAEILSALETGRYPSVVYDRVGLEFFENDRPRVLEVLERHYLRVEPLCEGECADPGQVYAEYRSAVPGSALSEGGRS